MHKYNARNDFGDASSRRRARRAAASRARCSCRRSPERRAHPSRLPARRPRNLGRLERQAVARAEPQVHRLGRARVAIAASRCRRSDRARSRRPAPRRRTPQRFQRRRSPSKPCADGPSPEIRHAGPVGRVVPCAEARAGEVRDLVVLEARSRERLVRVQELVRVAILVGLGDVAPLGPATQRRARLDGEPVEREMRRLERERGGDVCRASLVRRCSGSAKMRSSERSVDATRASRDDRAADLSGVVRAVHPRERGGIEALAAEREPVDAGRPPGHDGLGRHVVRIGLERDLRARLEQEPLAQQRDGPRDAVGPPRRDGVPPPK